MEKYNIRSYWRAIRPFSFTASATAVLFGSILPIFLHNEFSFSSVSLLYLFLVAIGAVSIHVVSNLVNTLYDYRTGLDLHVHSGGANNAIVLGLLTEKEVRNASLLFFFIALAVAAHIVLFVNFQIVWLVAVGIFSAYFYTAPPFALKYRGLGDIQVILSFGVLMILGAYSVQISATGQASTFQELLAVLLFSLPLSFLANAVLHANNHRDRTADREHHAYTLAVRLSEKGSKIFQVSLIVSAYAIAVGTAWLYESAWLLTPLFSVPYAAKTVGRFVFDGFRSAAEYERLPAGMANIHLQFGLLQTLSVLLSRL